eukprot:TRINITY_DN122999_c0_g1_i1.p1 TRINITY_DN122999_c0_g1~~TRINITY_DN122999_c0_g1_i1.p1  ORF type:complete len:382 (+),score=69.98 TRINITY_DN122999_c0_g1_i1:63-1148(+)
MAEPRPSNRCRLNSLRFCALALLCGVLAASSLSTAFLTAAQPALRGHARYLGTNRRSAQWRSHAAVRAVATASDVVEKAPGSDLEERAQNGEADAAFQLGVELKRRARAEKSEDLMKEAFDYFYTAAEDGHAKAQHATAVMLSKGQGVERDVSVAKYYYNKAAENGHVKSQHMVGLLYYLGKMSEDGKCNSLGAAFWFKKAAEAGHAESQYRLGGMILSGDGVIRNETMAAELLERAAEQDHTEAQEAIGLLYRGGMGVEQDARTAASWLEKAAEKDDAQACFTLACMLRVGEGRLKKDAPAAIQWLTRAADNGDSEAARELAVMYLSGEGTAVNEEGAAYWFQQADEIDADVYDPIDLDG